MFGGGGPNTHTSPLNPPLLSHNLYNIYASDIPSVDNIPISTYADDIALLSEHSDIVVAFFTL